MLPHHFPPALSHLSGRHLISETPNFELGVSMNPPTHAGSRGSTRRRSWRSIHRNFAGIQEATACVFARSRAVLTRHAPRVNTLTARPPSQPVRKADHAPTFLACGICEEALHGRVRARFLSAAGQPVGARPRSQGARAEWLQAASRSPRRRGRISSACTWCSPPRVLARKAGGRHAGARPGLMLGHAQA